MRPSKEPKRRSRPSSPLRDRTTAPSSGFERSTSPQSRASRLTSPVSLLKRDLEELQELATSSNTNPRIFPYNVKQQCWEKAEKIRGRDPDRWRRDSLGNTVFRKLVGCPGCLCHDYDHIVPYSKGGQSTLDNCQVLQATVNRSKGNRTEFSRAELIQKSSYCRVSGRDMDLIELSAYGNVRHAPNSGGCRIQ
ncbi:PREDICTED: uncharacterized protein LOC103338500 [Prunus mume]|uniref:Uncharacterized protein LOC103338500 n=1 Tax=Prunus mume TaxID=102107 RepID=A0ABM0PI41_PRUMU|nr:PREDICTED: uncharacterized protein LOC103338500 [Prunus mume]